MRIILLLLITSMALAQSPCNKVKKKIDKFNGNVFYQSPYHYISTEHPVRMSKVYVQKTQSWYVSFSMLVRTVGIEAGETNVDILFEGGTNWERSSTPTYYRETYNNVYDASIILSNSDLEFMVNNRIKSYRFYGITRNVNWILADKIKGYAECMLSITDP